MPFKKGSVPHNYVEPPAPGMRTCKVCETVKPEEDFYGRSHRCKPCSRQIAAETREERYPKIKNRDMLALYGISLEEYYQRLEEQGGTCYLCPATPPTNTRKKFLCVDHDHETGKVRGLLCDKCNRGLGLLGDDADRLLRAANYINFFK